MYSEVEWLLILIAAAVGIGTLGGSLLRTRGYEAGFISRYGCLLPGLGLGGLGLLGVVGGLSLLDPELGLGGALLAGVPSVGLGIAVGYGFSRSDYGIGELGSYGAGLGSLALSGVIAFGVSGPTGGTAVVPTPTAALSPTASQTVSPPSPTATLTASPTASASTTVTPVPIGQRTDFFDALIDLGAIEPGRVDEYMDDYETDPEEDHSHATGDTPGFTPGFVDLRGYVGFSWTIDESTAGLLESAFPCQGGTSTAFAVQCLGTMPIAAGDWVFVNAMAGGPLPLTFDSGSLATLAVVFDDDGDPATGFQPDPAFPGDSYQGSTMWYEQIWFGNGSTCLATDTTRRADDGSVQRNNFMSQGRFVTWRQNSMDVAEFGLMVPASEVGGFYRSVLVGTRDASTYAPADTSHDYSEADGPFSFHPLESY